MQELNVGTVTYSVDYVQCVWGVGRARPCVVCVEFFASTGPWGDYLLGLLPWWRYC